MLFYALLMMAGVFAASLAQVLLKKAAVRHHGNFLANYLNAYVLTAYGVMFGTTFLSIYALRVIPLSLGALLEATGYVYATVFGVLFFQERLNGRKLLALCLILIGIAVFSLLG